MRAEVKAVVSAADERLELHPNFDLVHPVSDAVLVDRFHEKHEPNQKKKQFLTCCFTKMYVLKVILKITS